MNRQLAELIHGREVRGGQIVVTAVELNPEIGILLHGDREVEHDVGRTGNPLRRARRLMQIVPNLLDVVFRLVDLIVAELERTARVVVECRYIRRGYRRGLRIVFRFLAQRIDGGAGKPGIEPSGGDLASQQGLVEFSAVDPEVRPLDVVGGKSGIGA